MPAKTTVFQSGALAFFILIPLFRPILLAHNLIYVIYAVFVISFLVLVANINVVKSASPTQLMWLFGYAGIAVVASLFAAEDIRLDYLGLLCFVPISYLVGIWLGAEGSMHSFFRVAALIFLPTVLYIVYQLAKSSFSYNTYYYWSPASYKIDYLTSSIYALVLLIYFVFNGRNVIEKYGLPAFCAGFIAISGARYSIIYAVCAGIYMVLRAAKKSPIRLATGTLISLSLLFVIVLFNNTLIAKSIDLVNYSLFRLENLSESDNSVEGRKVLMEKASQIVSDHFAFGVGLAGSADVLGTYPHNMLLEAFVDGGFFSALPLLIFLVSSLWLLIKTKHEHKAWCLLLVLYLLGAFLKSFSIYESRMLFFFMGYAATLNRREQGLASCAEQAAVMNSYEPHARKA
jgi:O-antigen ligase